MKVALIGDMHANLPALEAVLAHARQRDVEAFWNIGDFVGYGPFPDEVVSRLRDRTIISIVGNYDTAVLRYGAAGKKKKDPAKDFAHRWAYENLSRQSRQYLQSLPEEVRLEIEGKRILLTHGSPDSPDEHLTPDTPDEHLAELARKAGADIVVCGHSHQAFVRRAGDVWFINTGSVGRPDDGDPRACYAILDLTPRRLKVRHYRVDYDVQRTIDAMREKHLPEVFIQMIVQARALDDVKDQQEAKPIAPADTALLESEDPRLGSVLQLARTCNYEQGHTHQVTRLVLKLFDELQSLHKLGPQERFWLHSASLLHDIGWIEGQVGHHKTALRIILDSPLLPFNGRERQIVGCIARYHRKAEPKKKHVPFGELGPQDREVVRTLSAILRVADSLDVMHEDRVRDLSAQIMPDEIVLHCTAPESLDDERKQALKKGGLFEEVFKRKLEIQWHHA